MTRVTIGRVTFDDGAPHEPGPPVFPNGPTVHIFDNWGQAQSIMRNAIPRNIYGTVRSEPDAFLGLEPKAIVDHTSEPWPPALRQILEWRAARAQIEIQRADENKPVLKSDVRLR